MASAGHHRILMFEGCEDGTAGGSHQVLYDTVRLMDHARYHAVVVFYEDNRFVAPLRELGATVRVWDRERAIERAPHEAGRRLAKLGSVVGAVRRRVRLMQEERIDLVYLNNTPYVGYDDWLPAARWLRLPCIAAVMGRPYELPAARIPRALMLRFDRLIAVSSNVFESLLQAGYPDGMVTKVQVGIDVGRFRSRVRVPAERVREALGIAPDRMLAVMVGNLRQWKGHHVVVAALEQMDAATRQRLHVAFVGAVRPSDEGYLAELRQRLERSGAAAGVSWLGSRSDVPDLLNAADLGLHASTAPEPFGLVLVEAMALGKPVVAARGGGPVDVVTPETGILFDPEDPSELASALERLLGKPELRQAMGAAARLRAECFTAQRMADGFQRVWDEALAAGRPPSRR
jgi:glycosyltransferase involved in cell wall biosynthesis